MADAVRITLSIPSETARSIDVVAKRLHVSRSALLATLLAEPIAELEKLVLILPRGKATEGDVKRLRGASIELVEKLVTEAQEIASGIDPEQRLL